MLTKCSFCLEDFSSELCLLEHQAICRNVFIKEEPDVKVGLGLSDLQIDGTQQSVGPVQEQDCKAVDDVGSVGIFTAKTCQGQDEKSHHYEVCDKLFTEHGDKVQLKRIQKGKPYVCEVCNKQFAFQSRKTYHMFVHTGGKPLSCEVCDKKFYQESKKIEHMKTHTGEKPYTCEVCDKAFANNSNKIQHMRIHTGEKPYACKFCDKTFAINSTKEQHLKLHTGERPYNCDLCIKSFSLHSSLRQHMRTHTGEKPYACDVCDQKFISRSSKAYHMRMNMHTPHLNL